MAATRRRLLAVVGLASLPPRRTIAGDGIATQRRRLARLTRKAEPARRIAKAYLAGIGATDAHRAALDLDMPFVLAPLDQIAGTAAARAWLGSRIRADFGEGAVIDVDGWRLSRTEVGVCLMIADMV
jgi:hypothetical protein